MPRAGMIPMVSAPGGYFMPERMVQLARIGLYFGKLRHETHTAEDTFRGNPDGTNDKLPPKNFMLCKKNALADNSIPVIFSEVSPREITGPFRGRGEQKFDDSTPTSETSSEVTRKTAHKSVNEIAGGFFFKC